MIIILVQLIFFILKHGKYQYSLSYTKKTKITSYNDMQVLNVQLMFGNNENNLENRTLEICIDDKYPLEFSITNARYDINSFEQNSVAKLQLKSISPTTNSINFNDEYKVDLYLKFPLNTFDTSDEVIDLTFEEYNTEINNSNIEFVSSSQFKEDIEEKELSDKIFLIVISIIISIFILRHFDMSIIHNSFVDKCLKEGIIYRDGWKVTRYDVRGPVKIVKTYRFAETKAPNAKDYLYYRKDKYSPKEIYEIVTGKELLSYQITTYKERVKAEINKDYIKYHSLDEALRNDMPNKPEYKIIWLNQKIYYLQKIIAKGPEQSEQSWHGPYGWRYHSTEEDIREFEYTKQELTNCKTELYSLKLKASNNEKNEWYWNETF